MSHYFIQMFFPGGYSTNPIAISEQILLTKDDPVLNYAAEKLAGNSNGILILFGLGKTIAYKYENKKLYKLKIE